MLKRLHLKNCFTHKDNVYEFNKGFTVISGKNETGKSLILEMVSYALFGTPALRGEASDYKNLYVELDVEIAGDLHKIIRHKKVQEVYLGTDIVAKGTGPINQYLASKLSYGIGVYNVANYVRQDNVSHLSDMTPANRKKIVDSVIGMEVIDNITSKMRDKLNNTRSILQGMDTLLQSPEEPVNPCPDTTIELTSSAIQQIKITNGQYLQTERDLKNLRSMVRVRPCELPDPCPDETVPSLQHKINIQQSHITLSRSVGTPIEAPYPPLYTVEQAELHQQWVKRENFTQEIEKISTPLLTISVEDAQKQCQDYANYATLRKHYESCQDIMCPNCSTIFKNVDQPVEPPIPIYSTQDILAEQIRLQEVSKLKHALTPLQNSVAILPQGVDYLIIPRDWVNYNLTKAAYDRQQVDLNKIKDLVNENPWLLEPIQYDMVTLLSNKINYNNNKDSLIQYDQWLVGYQSKERELLDKLNSLNLVEDNILISLEETLLELQAYQVELRLYTKSKQTYEDNLIRKQQLTNKVSQYEKVIIAMQEVRVKVKEYLVPSLNKVSSSLLSRMTGGEHNEVAIDPDFNILIDGQSIDTLSGSAKAVSNLAIRIGLGQVLTNSKLSILLCDEIDHGCDIERSQYLMECISNLTSNIGQVIVISHKETEAQHYITLPQQTIGG
jgi:DNA repair exonuclease SbcCD ATPase subunit